MLLAIDVDNTNVEFGVSTATGSSAMAPHTSAMRTADEHAVWLFQLMAMEDIDPQPSRMRSWQRRAAGQLQYPPPVSRYFNCESLFLGDPDVVLGIKV